MPSRTGLDVLEYEIRQEQAATIGRLARDLRDALDGLDAFDRRASGSNTAADSRDPQRASRRCCRLRPLEFRRSTGMQWLSRDGAGPQGLRRSGRGARKDGAVRSRELDS